MTLFKLDFDPKKGRKKQIKKINQLILGTFKKQKKDRLWDLLKKKMLRYGKLVNSYNSVIVIIQEYDLMEKLKIFPKKKLKTYQIFKKIFIIFT